MRCNRVAMMFIAVSALVLGTLGTLAAQAAPAGATAKCGDGTYSKAKTNKGACSKHKGVAEWYGPGAKAAATPAPAAPAAPAPSAAPAGAPKDATALCNDGTYSKSQHRSGTCSHHGGVKQWLKEMPK